jgi:putative N-acetylmannosamine-6-phosphate epimerase
MGDQKFEHTQNITLQRILQTCITLRSLEDDMEAQAAQAAVQGGAAGLDAAAVADIAAARKLQVRGGACCGVVWGAASTLCL